jgi:hypothetical protein
MRNPVFTTFEASFSHRKEVAKDLVSSRLLAKALNFSRPTTRCQPSCSSGLSWEGSFLKGSYRLGRFSCHLFCTDQIKKTSRLAAPQCAAGLNVRLDFHRSVLSVEIVWSFQSR